MCQLHHAIKKRGNYFFLSSSIERANTDFEVNIFLNYIFFELQHYKYVDFQFRNASIFSHVNESHMCPIF